MGKLFSSSQTVCWPNLETKTETKIQHGKHFTNFKERAQMKSESLFSRKMKDGQLKGNMVLQQHFYPYSFCTPCLFSDILDLMPGIKVIIVCKTGEQYTVSGGSLLFLDHFFCTPLNIYRPSSCGGRTGKDGEKEDR